MDEDESVVRESSVVGDSEGSILGKIVSSVKELVLDDRFDEVREEDPLFGGMFAEIDPAVRSLLADSDFQSFLMDEWAGGRIAEQHGDPRTSNVFLLEREDSSYEAFLIDPVRLFRMSEEIGEYELKADWFRTHDLFQIGLLAAQSYSHPEPERRVFARRVLDSYKKYFTQNERYPGESERMKYKRFEQLMGLSFYYGCDIEFLVLNYRRHESGVAELMEPYANAMLHLAQTDFLGWKEVL